MSTQAGSAEEGASIFLFWGNAEEELACTSFLRDLALYCSWDKVLFTNTLSLESGLSPKLHVLLDIVPGLSLLS